MEAKPRKNRDNALIISKLMGGGRAALLMLTLLVLPTFCACSVDEPQQTTVQPSEPEEWTDTLILY